MLAGKVYSGRLVRPALFGGSPEWTAGVRRHPTAVVATAVVLLVCACIPYAGFPALYLAAAACGAFYAANEPLQLLLLPGKGAARLLARKIFTAWRNYFLMTAPFAVLALLAQPRSAWMAAAWAPLRWRCSISSQPNTPATTRRTNPRAGRWPPGWELRDFSSRPCCPSAFASW